MCRSPILNDANGSSATKDVDKEVEGESFHDSDNSELIYLWIKLIKRAPVSLVLWLTNNQVVCNENKNVSAKFWSRKYNLVTQYLTHHDSEEIN